MVSLIYVESVIVVNLSFLGSLKCGDIEFHVPFGREFNPKESFIHLSDEKVT